LALLALTDGYDKESLDFTIWLRAIAGDGDVPKVSASRPENLGSRSGFLAAKVATCSIVMRVGAQGLHGRASHDHDDAQSIWLSVHGQDVIVDRGCYSYTLDPAMRNDDISSRAHNVLQPVDTPRFGGSEGSINLTMRGAPTCSVAEVKLTDGSPTFTTTIDRAGPLLKITRVVDIQALTDGIGLHVVDTWSSAEPAELRWHFGPGLEPEIAGANAIVFRESALVRALEFESASLSNLEVFSFDFSPIYGQKRPCFGVRAVLAPVLHGTLISRFQIGSVGEVCN
jgi:hypothetical protein